MGRLNSIWCLVCLGVLTCFQPAYSQGAPAAPQPGAVPALVAPVGPGAPVAPARGGIPTISNIPIPGARAVGVDVLNSTSVRGEEVLAVKPSGQVVRPTAIRANEFQLFIERSTGLQLPMFGQELFGGAPGTFAPAENIPATRDYAVGPGDELLVRAWGQIDINLRLIVDRNGAIDIPQVGVVQVAGLKANELSGFIKGQVGRVFKNFEMNVTLGRLRSIQVLVVGHVRRPGNYTISSLSTLINALFASGGPSEVGSTRKIQLKRGNVVVAEFDLYDLLLKGDKSKDMKLLQGDVIHVPPMGALVAVAGSVQVPAVFELKGGESMDDLLGYAGGFSATAFTGRVTLERIKDNLKREIVELELDPKGRATKAQNGDLIQVFPISPRFEKVVTLRGHVAAPRRVPWREGMRITDLIPDRASLVPYDYWLRKNEAGNTGAANVHEQARGLLQEINWDYASISRVEPNTLKNHFVSFNLGKALQQDDPENNHILHAGDVVTIYSKADIRVSLAKRSGFVSLEGEFVNSGLYQIRPGETLRDLVRRVGGFTPDVYLYGAVFTRESTQREQQLRQDESLRRLETELRHAHARLQGEALTPEESASASTQVEGRYAMIQSMRQVRATGRIVLELSPRSGTPADLSEIQLRDGDRLVVPSRPAEIYVMGEVYNQQSRLWKPEATVGQYMNQAGGVTRNADSKYMYIIRADGSIYSRNYAGRSFAKARLYPGDTIVVPEKLDYSTWKKELKDWAQIASQIAIGAAAIKVLSSD